MIKVLVVEDSPVARELLLHILGSDTGIQVVAVARDGEEAVAIVPRLRPDVITMDVHMPKMDGMTACRRIMETDPTPIILVSGGDTAGDIASTFDALEAGALVVLRRPAGVGHPDHVAGACDLVAAVKTMAGVKLVRRWPKRQQGTKAAASQSERLAAPAAARIVAIGASTGGPPALNAILSGLPKAFPVPVVIVQHMAPGFIQGFADWLGHSSGMPVRVAVQGDFLRPGSVYVAPDACHMKVDRIGRIQLALEAAEGGLRPAVSCLFRSVAESYGAESVAGLLSGMGRDGVAELKVLKERGAITFAQDKESSVVHGMPGEAIRLDAAMLVLPPERIAAFLTGLTLQGLLPKEGAT